jgi:hypothetical protein
MKPFEYFDKRAKVLLHDVNTYTLTEHREAVPAIVALTAELNDTDYHYALEAYLKGRASCMADTVKELDGDEISLDRVREILRNLRDEWLPQTNSDFNAIVTEAIRMSVTDEAIDNELKDRGYYD